MKKVLSVILSLTMVLSLAACGAIKNKSPQELPLKAAPMS